MASASSGDASGSIFQPAAAAGEGAGRDGSGTVPADRPAHYVKAASILERI